MSLAIETALEEALGRLLPTDVPSHLSDALRYSLLNPGKRIRPRLVLACAEMMGLKQEAALPAALALEMIHTFTLIHDDMPCLDNDDTRRGKPTVHKRYGEATALLAGDALMALGMEIFMDAQKHSSPSGFAEGLRRLIWASGPRGVIGGQAGESLLDEDSTLEDLRRVHQQKTGALFVASLLIPKDFANIKDESSQGLAIQIFARELGHAFQIADDLEDALDPPGPANILHYLPRSEIQSMTAQRLGAAMMSLQTAWPKTSKSLTQVGEEVLRSLGAAPPQIIPTKKTRTTPVARPARSKSTTGTATTRAPRTLAKRLT